MNDVARQNYPDRDTLMRSLAELVADQLRAAHASKDRATLAVPGGTTPAPFLKALSETDLAWRDVSVMLTDERVVSELSLRSNLRLIRETLHRNEAAAAKLIDLNGLNARAHVEAALPIDVLVIGMGTDMHTASLFPGAPELGDALADNAPPIFTLHPPGQPEARRSLTARVLRGASVIHVLITGPDKAVALETALADGSVADAPIRSILSAPCPVTVHYAD